MSEDLDSERLINLLCAALADAEVTMNHARVFISSRQRMHPDGVKLYEECLLLVRETRLQATRDGAGHTPKREEDK